MTKIVEISDEDGKEHIVSTAIFNEMTDEEAEAVFGGEEPASSVKKAIDFVS